MACLFCTSKRSVWEKNNGWNQNFENWRRFFLVFVKNSKRHTHDRVFRRSTIIMPNKDYHESWILIQICIVYSSIPTYRWYLKFDVKVFNNIKPNVAILQYKTDIAYTYCKQLTCTVLSIYTSPFWGIHEKSRNVSFSKFWNCRRHELAEFRILIRCFS